MEKDEEAGRSQRMRGSRSQACSLLLINRTQTPLFQPHGKTGKGQLAEGLENNE